MTQTTESRRGNALAARLPADRKALVHRIYAGVLLDLNAAGLAADNDDADALYASLAWLLKNAQGAK
jgi:hypothetical protein